MNNYEKSTLPENLYHGLSVFLVLHPSCDHQMPLTTTSSHVAQFVNTLVPRALRYIRDEKVLGVFVPVSTRTCTILQSNPGTNGIHQMPDFSSPHFFGTTIYIQWLAVHGCLMVLFNIWLRVRDGWELLTLLYCINIGKSRKIWKILYMVRRQCTWLKKRCNEHLTTSSSPQ